MTKWHLGTMGFSYEGWAGVFYPTDMRPRQYLAHYSQVFNAVEVDSTFYGTPRPSTVRRWATSTPVGFTFCPKVPREITHEQRLAGSYDAMAGFLEVMRLLGDKLGPILIQLPPSFPVQELAMVDEFLAALPQDLPFAIEFRHPSWYQAQTGELLNAHRVAWVCLDYLDLPKQVQVTASFLYVRWIGHHGRFASKDRELVDVTPQLHWWWSALRPHLDRVEAVYGFFNDDYAGHSPATLNRFKRVAGLPVVEPEIPRQERLL